MRILVLNCGSSSLKYQLFDLSKGEMVLAKGLVERIGIPGGHLKQTTIHDEVFKVEADIADHTIAIQMVLKALISGNQPVINSVDEINAVGHRVVHGGEHFTSSVIVDSKVKQHILECSDLAPLHNPANLKGILSMEAVLPNVPQVAVFDTSFHQTIPQHAYLYGIPYKFYEENKIRKYGFHGVSHEFVSKQAAKFVGKDISKLKIITCHLGNGASITAVDGGKSVDTSMGFTPVTGLMMGTRCGMIDPGVLLYLSDKYELNTSQLSTILNKDSGVLGISGVSSDMRDVEHAAEEGIERAQLALEMYAYRLRKYIGSFVAAMDGLDVLVFTGGIGENSSHVRAMVCEKMSYFGIEIDEQKNMESCGEDMRISSSNSNVDVLVVKTNEELVIARVTNDLVK